MRKGTGRANTPDVHSARLKTVLLFVVIGDAQIEVGPDRIFHATPKYLEDLVGRKIGVVNGSERIATGDEAAGR